MADAERSGCMRDARTNYRNPRSCEPPESQVESPSGYAELNRAGCAALQDDAINEASARRRDISFAAPERARIPLMSSTRGCFLPRAARE